MLVALTLVWGANWPLFPLAVREVSVWTFRALAMVVSGGVLLLLAHLRGESLRIPRRDRVPVVLASVVYLTFWNITSTYAALLIPSGQAAVLGFTMPLWLALISWLVVGTALTPRLRLALLLGGAGVVLLMVPSFRAYAGAPLGFVLGIASAICWAIGTLILQRARVQMPVMALTGWQLLLGAAPIVVVALWRGDGQWFMPSWTSIAVIAWITLVPMCIGNVCWFGIVRMLPANVAGLSSVMVPVVAMITGALVHAEPLGPLQWISVAASVAGLVLALGHRTP